jgi:hypothetical protein
MAIDPLAWEMAQWEIHALRSLVAVMIGQVETYALTHPDARALYDALLLSVDNTASRAEW